jgi:hypothetical protein
MLWSEVRKKEWWYTGVWDPDHRIYVSWYFVRVNFVDEIGVTVFDPAVGPPAHFEKRLWLDPVQPPDELSLVWDKGRTWARYTGSADKTWHFDFSAGDLRVDLQIAPTTSPFTKFDNTLSKNYGLLHFFHNRVAGLVSVGGRSYRLENALGYYDHCFGRVPRQSGWHWLAVQNRDVALASLVNYGPYAQRYSQVWLGGGPPELAGRWIRLEQSVSFENPRTTELEGSWRLTSTDLDLSIDVLPKQLVTSIRHIPPLTRFIVDLQHTEMFVRASGRVRVDRRWLPLEEPLYGVMEQHHGKW